MENQDLVRGAHVNPLVYLHDIRETAEGQFGANLTNTDLLSDVERYIEFSNSKVLTADDGYRSVQLLLPLLERTGTRLILFLTTGFLDRTVFPYEVVVSNMISRLPQVWVFGEVFGTGNSSEAKEAAFKKAHMALKPQTHKRRLKMMDRLASENGATKEEFFSDLFLSWEEAAHLAAHPLIDIGAHSHRHLHLPDIKKAQQISELFVPRMRLSRKLSTSVTTVAYPYGGENRRVRQFARACGYSCAYGTSSDGASTFSLPRQTLSSALETMN